MNRKKQRNPRTKRNNQKRGYGLGTMGRYTAYERPGLTFLDPHRYLTFKYTELFTSSVATITGTQQIMRLNSLFDPDSTGVGHQPLGFDQIAALYNRYRVLKTRWRVTFGPETGTFNIVVVPVNGTLATPVVNAATFETAGETPRAVLRKQGATAGMPIVINGGIRLCDLNGVTITEYLADDRFEAAVTTSPAEVMSLYICLYNGTASTIGINYTVEMWFEVDMHDPILPGSS